MPDADFGIVIKQGNKKFRECIARKCKMSYEEALKNKDNKCRKACVAEVCAYVVKRLKEEIKKCKNSKDPAKCRENGKKLIRSYSDAYKKVTGESLTEGKFGEKVKDKALGLMGLPISDSSNEVLEGALKTVAQTAIEVPKVLRTALDKEEMKLVKDKKKCVQRAKAKYPPGPRRNIAKLKCMRDLVDKEIRVYKRYKLKSPYWYKRRQKVLKQLDRKIQKQKERLRREEFLTPPSSSLLSENEASKKFNQLINGMNKCTFSIKKGLRNRKQAELLRITRCKIPYLKRIINLFRSLGDERSVKVWQADLDKQIRKAKKLKEKIQSQR